MLFRQPEDELLDGRLVEADMLESDLRSARAWRRRSSLSESAASSRLNRASSSGGMAWGFVRKRSRVIIGISSS
jgi:hypothetical protein